MIRRVGTGCYRETRCDGCGAHRRYHVSDRPPAWDSYEGLHVCPACVSKGVTAESVYRERAELAARNDMD